MAKRNSESWRKQTTWRAGKLGTSLRSKNGRWKCSCTLLKRTWSTLTTKSLSQSSIKHSSWRKRPRKLWKMETFSLKPLVSLRSRKEATPISPSWSQHWRIKLPRRFWWLQHCQQSLVLWKWSWSGITFECCRCSQCSHSSQLRCRATFTHCSSSSSRWQHTTLLTQMASTIRSPNDWVWSCGELMQRLRIWTWAPARLETLASSLSLVPSFATFTSLD